MPQAGKGGAPTPFSNAFKGPSVNSLRYNTSIKGSVLPVVYGTQRAAVNIIGGFGFSGSAGGGKKGGGKGGGKGSKKGGGNFSVNVAMAICQGPVSFRGAPAGFVGSGSPPNYNRVWADGGVSGVQTSGLTTYAGVDGATPDPVFASSSGDPPILGYSGTAYATGTPMQLGSTPALPNISFEISGMGSIANGGPGCGPNFPGDTNPEFIISDLMTNSRYGCGFPAANVDSAGSFADFANYCQAAEIAMSVTMDRQQPAARWIEEICQLAVAAPLWSGTLFKIIPYYTGVLSANSATWTPSLVAQYALTDADLLDFSGSPFGGTSGGGSSGTDPVTVTRSDPAQATNWLGIEFMDVTYSYNQEVIPVFDQGAIDTYGIKQEPSVLAPEITNPTSATASGQLQLQRKQYVRNTFKFKLGWRFALLEPMDIVDVSDTVVGLSAGAVRITQIDEDDNGELTITAEEMPDIATLPVFARQATAQPPVFDLYAAPGDANPPILYEPPASLTGGGLELWVVATGASADWGGCEVDVSLDGSTYKPVGTILRGGRQGVLTANLPSGADPDTVDTLSVDLTESKGQLLSGSQADADSFVTLCLCNLELVSYETATLTSAYHYDLTYLRRGAYGTPIAAASAGDQFARLDPASSLVKYIFPANFIGQTIFVKLQSFNLFGNELQDLSIVTAYSVGLVGTGAPVAAAANFDWLGLPVVAGTPIVRHTFANSFSVATGLVASSVTAGVTSAGTVIFDLAKNGVNFATATFSAGVAAAALAGTVETFNSGDVLTMTPRTGDATLAQISVMLYGIGPALALPNAVEFDWVALPPAGGQPILRWTFGTVMTFPANFAGSLCAAATASTGTVVFDIAKNGGNFATLTFTASAAGVFSGSAASFAIGDVLTMTPRTADATLSGISGFLFGADDGAVHDGLVPLEYIELPPTAGKPVMRWTCGLPTAFPDAFAGSVVTGAVAATADTVCDIAKNGSNFATLTIAAGHTSASFSGPAQSFASGDVLTVTPRTSDATLTQLSGVLIGSA